MICLTHAHNGMYEYLLSTGINNFPFHCYFQRDSSSFLKQYNETDRLGGTLSHLETEFKD